MAISTNAFIVCRHRSLRLHRGHSLNLTCPPPANYSSFFKPAAATATLSLTLSTASASAVYSSAASTSSATDLELLREHLSSGDFRQADEETRRLLIVLAGEAAQRRGYVFFSEVQFIPGGELKAIDSMWREHSGGRFGYSVQKRVWEKVNRDFTRFFIQVGWMKKLESGDVVQYNYRAFPAEFVWEIGEGSPAEGHLPLTNALRGTQLLASIFNHPAFQEEGEGEAQGSDAAEGGGDESRTTTSGAAKTYKPNYSF